MNLCDTFYQQSITYAVVFLGMWRVRAHEIADTILFHGTLITPNKKKIGFSKNNHIGSGRPSNQLRNQLLLLQYNSIKNRTLTTTAVTHKTLSPCKPKYYICQ